VSARDRIAPVFDLAPFIQLLGYTLVDAGDGWVETALTLEERHLQQHGFAHAGVVTTMADHTAGGAASTVVEPGNSVLTATLSIQLLRPARGSRLTCRGEVVKSGRRIIAAQADVHCDDKHVARLQATMAVVPLDIEA
jgi:uncharacterized protein (TIGR00369 family)